jgi:hypothetical protein
LPSKLTSFKSIRLPTELPSIGLRSAQSNYSF